MFCHVTLTCALWLAPVQGVDSDDHPLQRLRTPDSVILAAIDEGRRRSPTFASLVDAIERSNIVVYVVRAQKLPYGLEGCLVASRSRSHTLKVLIARRSGLDWTIMTIAHELQHVREVLDAGGGNDQAAFDSLFTRIGVRQPGTHQYETAAAQEVPAIVGRELRASREMHAR